MASTSPPGRRVQQGLDLSALPPPQDMAPVAGYLAGEPACTGQIIFSAGPELSLIGPPRLIEAFSAERSSDLARALDALSPVVLCPADAQQRTTGGANARVGAVFGQSGRTSAGAVNGSRPGRCLIVFDQAAMAAELGIAASRVGLHPLAPVGLGAPLPNGFAAAEEALNRAAEEAGGVGAVVLALGQFAGSGEPGDPSWPELLAGYAPTAGQVLAHAGWLSAVARYAVGRSRPDPVVQLADATSPALRPGAPGRRAAGPVRQRRPAGPARRVLRRGRDRVARRPASGGRAGRLAARSDQSTVLRGAELFARPGWMGLRSHPGPVASLCHGTPPLPAWFDDWLRDTIPLTGSRPRQAEPAG